MRGFAAHDRLTDIPWVPPVSSRTLWMRALAAIGLLAAVSYIVFLLGHRLPEFERGAFAILVVPAVTAVGLLPVAIAQAVRRRRRVRAVLREPESWESAESIVRAVGATFEYRDPWAIVRLVSRSAAAQRVCGLTIRIYDRRAPDVPQPWADPVEPRRFADAANPRERTAAEQRWHNLRVVAYSLFVILTVAWIALNVSLVMSRIARNALVYMAIVLVASIVALVRQRERYLVCGGLIQRTAWGWQRSWRLQYFVRSRCAAVVWHSRRRCEISIADGERRLAFHASADECARFLAAWLSPVAPPAWERLSDLR